MRIVPINPLHQYSLNLLLVFCSITAYSQQQKVLPVIKLNADTFLTTGNNKLVSINLQVENNGPDSFHGKIKYKLPKGLSMVTDRQQAVGLSPKSREYFPFKILIKENAASGENPIVFELYNDNDELQSFTTGKIFIETRQSVALILKNPSIILQQIGDSLNVEVTVKNGGNQTEAVKLVATFPGNNAVSKNMLVKEWRLPPASDTTVKFSTIITKEIAGLDQFYINVAGLINNTALFGNVVAQVQNGAASKHYQDPTQQYNLLNSPYGNQISLKGQNLFNPSASWQLNGSGSYSTGSGNLDFNAEAYKWVESSSKPLVSNTWLSYKTNNKGVLVGNISESMETSFNGRGIKLFSQDENKHQGFEAAFIDKSYNLFGNGYNNGNMAYFRANFADSAGNRYSSTLIYDYAPAEQGRNYISANSFSFFGAEKIKLDLTLGGGLTQDLYTEQPQIKPSLAAGINLNGNLGRYSFSSTNFYSTAYYPGTRRGVLQLNERLSRQFNKTNLYINYSHYQYDPAYFQAQYIFQHGYILDKGEGGSSFSIGKATQLSLTFVQQRESALYGQFSPEREQLNAFRLNESLTWHDKDYNQNLYLSIDNGMSTSAPSRQLQFKLNAVWSYRWFNLNTYLQRGSFLLAENLYLQPGQQSISRWSASPYVHSSFFDKKLSTEAGFTFYKDAYTGDNISINAKAEYAITRKTSFYISSYTYKYNNPAYNTSFTSLQAGITQKLPQSKPIHGKNATLEIMFYLDNNHNGVFDEADGPATAGMVFIDKTIFIIPKNGLIKYYDVPYGNHTVQMPLQNGWQITPQLLDISEKKVHLNIPLQKSGNVRGHVVYAFDEKLSMSFNQQLTGISIALEGQDGKQYRTKTNELGEFSIYLPEGLYQVIPDIDGLPDNISYTGNPYPVKIIAGSNTTIPTFSLTVKEKKVEIKHFKS